MRNMPLFNDYYYELLYIKWILINTQFDLQTKFTYLFLIIVIIIIIIIMQLFW